MRSTSVAAAILTAITTVGAPLSATEPASEQDRKITVIGCAVKGDSDGDGFLLVNNVERTVLAAITPTPTGIAVNQTTTTQLTASRVLFWLDDDDDAVERFVGQMVEVTGKAEGAIKQGEIKAERENGMIELEINAAGRKANVKVPDVPSAVGRPGSVGDRERDLPYLVQKLDVESARSVSPNCR
jgi:hypothetical protein